MEGRTPADDGARRADGGRPARRFDYDRTVALSDGVFAIALTLLVLAIDVPDLPASQHDRLWTALTEARYELLSYVISFVVIGALWVRHHSFMRELGRIDGPITALNLAYLGLVAFVPYPTELIGEYADQPSAVVVYAATIAAIAIVSALMHVHAARSGLLEPSCPVGPPTWGLAVVPAAFLGSIPVAFASTDVAILIWLSMLLHPRRWRARAVWPVRHD